MTTAAAPRRGRHKTAVAAFQPADEMIWHLYSKDLQAEGKSPATVLAYMRPLVLLSAFLVTLGATLETAGRVHVSAWLAEGRQAEANPAGWGKSTQATYMRRVKTFYAWAIRNDLYDGKSPLATLKTVREESHVHAIPAPEEIAAMITACEMTPEIKRGTWMPRFARRRDMAMLRVMLEPGTPRASELANLRLDQLDLTHDSILLDGKGGLQRVVPLGARAVKALALYLRERAQHPRAAQTDRVFLGAKSTDLTRDGVYKIMVGISRRAGLRTINPHLYRHLTADAWFAAGGSEREAMKLFGWRMDTMAKRYGAEAAARRSVEHARQLSIGDKW